MLKSFPRQRVRNRFGGARSLQPLRSCGYRSFRQTGHERYLLPRPSALLAGAFLLINGSHAVAEWHLEFSLSGKSSRRLSARAPVPICNLPFSRGISAIADLPAPSIAFDARPRIRPPERRRRIGVRPSQCRRGIVRSVTGPLRDLSSRVLTVPETSAAGSPKK